MTNRKTFRLDKLNGKFMGVCAGIANYTGIDVTIVRIAAVVVTLLGGFPWTLIAYGVAAWLAKPMAYDPYDITAPLPRTSVHEARTNMRDIDRRMSAIENYVTSSSGRLAREIDELR